MSAAKWLPFLLMTFVVVAAFSTVAAQNSTIPVGGTNTVDREALLAIKSMIIGDPQGFMSSWNDSNVNFCQWQGVTCSLRHGRVTVLNLSSGGLLGSLSPFVGNLSFLRALQVQNNSLSGEIPPQLGRLFRLQLRLHNNSFTGNIPVSITNCTNLEFLLLGYNNLVGTIPDGIGSLSMLSILNLHENILQGGIPRFIGNLTLLDTLSFRNCELGGTVPDVFHRLSNLGRYSMVGNNLVGTIPPSLFNLSSLEELFIDNNRLTSRLPTNLNMTLPRLRTLSLPNNLFTGPLPPSIFNSRELRVLDVAENNLTGKLVIDSREVCQIVLVSLSWNNFGSGEDDDMKFIDGLSTCNNLEKLLLSYTRMRGFLPESLGNLSTSLNQLDLASNALFGSLPSSVGNLSGLTSLDVSNKQRNKLSLAVILVISIVPLLLCVALILLIFICRRKREAAPEPIFGESFIQVSYETLYKATNGFSTKNLISMGSFSSVYKGCIDSDGGVIVAIKVLNLHHKGGTKSFISECEVLRNTRHRNLIKVITCCSGIDFQENDFKAIVYDFMPNGNLDQWLHNELPPLSLLQRVCIALDVAYALDYLHHHAAKTIVHCDLKPSNILLDEELVAHVGDFGISKILQSEYQNRQHSSSIGVRGSIGYAAPEYGVGSKLSRRGDMYSYGILLLEMMTNKKPTDAMFMDGLSLHSYAKKARVDATLGIVNPMLLNNNGMLSPGSNKEETIGYMNRETCLRLLLEIGVSCSMEWPQYRMDIASVIQQLQLIKDAILRDSTVSINFV